MSIQIAKDEYTQALRQGQREYKELTAAGKSPYPAVLDEILGDNPTESVQNIGLVEIPAERIVGTKSAGRITAFTASFQPLLGVDSEFAQKWVSLCDAHLGDTGIREPITCYEYLGNFYVQEGNKRVSVLRHFDASRIPGNVKRVLPDRSDDPRIKAYYEFLDFYKNSQLYIVQFRRPGDYAKLLAYMGRDPEKVWDDADRRNFSAYFHYFREAFLTQIKSQDILPEEALLLWLEVHPYTDLGDMSSAELKRSLAALWPDVVSSSRQSEVKTNTDPLVESRSNILNWIISSTPDHLNIAFVHQLDPKVSGWVQGHEEGRKYIEEVFGDKITTRSYYGANHAAEAEKAIEQAVADGADVVFSTAPKLIRATLKFAVQYPKVRFFNCSVDQPYSTVRTYYGRIFEAKFITGAIAGAMAQNDRIGYIGSNPIFGVPASINAFALGAQMTNPRAQIELRWSCCAGNPQSDFFRDGIRVVSNRDVPTADKVYLEFCNYGTYLMDERGGLVALASPVWVWGKFYEYAIRAILSGVRRDDKDPKAINYWLGMDSGVIGLQLAERLPAGVRMLAQTLSNDISNGTLHPFFRKILAQDGSVKNDGSRDLTAEELLHMDWLAENIIGSIPPFEEILPQSQSIVRKLGIYRDQIPVVKES